MKPREHNEWGEEEGLVEKIKDSQRGTTEDNEVIKDREMKNTALDLTLQQPWATLIEGGFIEWWRQR